MAIRPRQEAAAPVLQKPFRIRDWTHNRALPPLRPLPRAKVESLAQFLLDLSAPVRLSSYHRIGVPNSERCSWTFSPLRPYPQGRLMKLKTFIWPFACKLLLGSAFAQSSLLAPGALTNGYQVTRSRQRLRRHRQDPFLNQCRRPNGFDHQRVHFAREQSPLPR